MSFKDAFFASTNKPKVEAVPFPEIGTVAHVRERSAADMVALNERLAAGEKQTPDYFARFVIECACDEAGNAIFTAADLPELLARPAGQVRRLFDAAARLNGLGDDKAIEKNS